MQKNKSPFLFITLFQFILILSSALFFIQDAKADGLATVSVPTTISSSTTWVEGYVYIINTTTINNGATVSVDPGAIVKFSTTTSRLTVNGALDVNGVATNSVYFTSLADDSVGGDSGNDGATTGQAYQWKDVYIGSTGNADIDNAVIRYGGNSLGSRGDIYNLHTLNLTNSTISSSYHGVYQSGSASSSTISNSVISNNGMYGLWIIDGSMDVSNSTISESLHDGIRIDSGADSVTINGNSINNNGTNAISLPASISGNNYFTESNNTANFNDINGIYLSGSSIATGSVTWPKTSIPYVLRTITIPQTATLSIDPGVVIKFDYDPAYAYITVDGVLDVNGTATQSVYFTSIYDDAADGLNTDNATNSVGVSKWKYITINSGGSANFDHAVVRYGSYLSSSNIRNSGGTLNFTNSKTSNGYHGIMQYSGSSTISNSEMSSNSYHGVWIIDGSADVSNSTIDANISYGIRADSNTDSITVSGNNITNGSNYAMNFSASALGKVHFTESGNTATNNLINGSYISGTTATGSITWERDSVPFVLGDVTIPSNATISVNPGVIFKFASSANRLTVNGVLDVNGVATNAVYFTSLKNDGVGGDTNNDGGASSAQAGDWKDIYINSTGKVYLDHAIVLFGGYSYGTGANIYNNGGTLVMNNSRSQLSYLYGIKQVSGTTTAKGVVLAQQSYGARVQGGSFEITDNSLFIGNTTFGIYNSSGYSINAENNHWGSDANDGPSGDGLSGSGDRITTNVDYYPWWGEGYYIKGISAVNKDTNEIRYTATTTVIVGYGTELSGAVNKWNEDPDMGKINIDSDTATTSVDVEISATYTTNVNWYGLTTILDVPESIVLNTYTIEERDELTPEQRQFVITHELGHALGLSDSVEVLNIMYEEAEDPEEEWQTYFGDQDKAAYNFLY